MRHPVAIATLATLLAATAYRPAAAQLGSLALGAAAGSTAITGNYSGVFASGFHAEGLLDLSLPLVPLGLRGELAYDHLDCTAPVAPYTGPGSAPTGSLKVASGVLDATFAMPFPLIHPYAIAGAGYYIRNASSLGGTRESALGLNAGIGAELRLPVIRLFAEARFHTIGFATSRINLIPITVGLVF